MKELGLFHSNPASGIEKVTLKGLELTLLASGDGTEMIHHRLEKGANWAMAPEEGWNSLESIFIISGLLSLKSDEGVYMLRPGDTLAALPIKKTAIFTAETDTEFLYISSQPIFHHYSGSIRDMLSLAVEIEQKDGYTADHCERIKSLSMTVGEKLGLSSQQLLSLNFGSFLHDIGKVMIPLSILGKPGKLTANEWRIMKRHTIYGSRKLNEMAIPSVKHSAVIVEQHHERFNGQGYPYGLSGSEICIEAAIVAVVDSYDAMTSDRVYRKGRSKEEALEEIVSSKDQYHPEAVEAFLAVSGKI